MPKMPKGMFKRGPSYYVRLFRGGRDRWVSLGGDLEAANRRMTALRSGERLPQRVGVHEAAERWLESYVGTRRHRRDHGMTRQRLRDYLLAFLGHRPLSGVTKEDVRAYRLWLERDGRLKPATVKHILSDLRCLLNWAVDSDLLNRSPFPRHIMPRIQERPPDRLSDEEVEVLLRLPEPYGFICRFGIGTGLRWGELVRARSSDTQNGSLVVHQTKSGKVRRVPLAPELSAELRYRVGRLMPLMNGWRFSQDVRKLSGIRRFHPHQMRHTYACQMLEAGVSLAAVQQLLGHSTVIMTQRYARLSDEAVRREVERAASSQGRTVAKP